jgi:hypothetical protein
MAIELGRSREKSGIKFSPASELMRDVSVSDMTGDRVTCHVTHRHITQTSQLARSLAGIRVDYRFKITVGECATYLKSKIRTHLQKRLEYLAMQESASEIV